MKAQDKDKYVKEARQLRDSLKISWFSNNPNNPGQISIINRLIAIFTIFSGNDGQELKSLFKEFQKWARAGERKDHIENCAVDMMQFIGQKIEEMDVYDIQDQSSELKRIVSKLKDEDLWVRVNTEGKDSHIFIGERNSKEGEHVHFIQDSETGEIRIHEDDKSPHGLVEKVVAVTMKSGRTVGYKQKGVKATLEFIDDEQSDEAMPIVYPDREVSPSGGPSGHFERFQVKNIGKNIATNIRWGIRGFGYEWRSPDIPFDLSAEQSKEVTYPISIERPFKEDIEDLCIFFEYNTVKGTNLFSRMELSQKKVPSGLFNNLKGGTYHYPTILKDDGLELIKILDKTGDSVKAIFKIGLGEKAQKVKIGISDTLLAAWDFKTESEIKSALEELGHRQIRNMIKDSRLKDLTFISADYPQIFQSGYEGYQALRDSL